MVSCGCSSTAFAARAGNRVTVQGFTAAEDDVGGRAETWADLFSAWAIIEPMAGREIWLNAQLQSRVDARITIRYAPALADTTLTATRRILFGTRLYNVQAIRNLADDMKTEGRVYQQIYCTEGEPT